MHGHIVTSTPCRLGISQVCRLEILRCGIFRYGSPLERESR
ncbi:hypothetical protein BIFDEN_01037 [Bifidobacterium dentium ATCC 27678]|nr:hypothetical protein BIFDEN_01037 [Bifidobacterium dentium ATCC 27678]